jgi:TolB-like protein
MKDDFLDKLKQKNISENTEKTKYRVREIWEKSDKKGRRELLAITGSSIYGTIAKATKNGRITAKVLILLSRYLDVNPFYILGETNEQGHYSDELLKELLVKLGYKKLWSEYSRQLRNENKAVEETEHEEADEPITETAETEPTDEKKHETEVTVVPDTSADISAEAINVANSLTEEEIITLVRSLLIQAKVPTSKSEKVAEQIKVLLLLN